MIPCKEVDRGCANWLDVPGFSGYQVSDQGHVRNKNGKPVRINRPTDEPNPLQLEETDKIEGEEERRKKKPFFSY